MQHDHRFVNNCVNHCGTCFTSIISSGPPHFNPACDEDLDPACALDLTHSQTVLTSIVSSSSSWLLSVSSG